MLVLEDVLSLIELEEFNRELNSLHFEDGAASAKGSAQAVKRNLEAEPRQPNVIALDRRLKGILQGNSALSSYARPLRWSRIIFSRYATGDGYGEHVDAPFMWADDATDMRADLSLTIFLAPPESYEGGELVIDTPWARRAVKLAAGSLVVYPTTVLHSVEPTRSGIRKVAVGWIQSRIRDTEQRSMLFDLEQAVAGLSHDARRRKLTRVFANLMKMWSV